MRVVATSDLAVMASLGLALAVGACQRPPSQTPSERDVARASERTGQPVLSALAGLEQALARLPSEGPADPAARVLPDRSLYHVSSRWTDQHGAERPLASLAGRVRIISMIYTDCFHTCPLIVAEMKRIEAELAPASLERVGFVLVSLDPERDTPERLRRFAEALDLEEGRWTLLAGGESETRELAALLDTQYRRISPTEITHANVITILDPAGEIVERVSGLDSAPRQPARAARP